MSGKMIALTFTEAEIASMDRMVRSSGLKTKHLLLKSLIREIIADEQADSRNDRRSADNAGACDFTAHQGV